VLEQFALNDLAVAPLHPLQVLQRLHELVAPVLDHDPRRLDPVLDVLDGLGDDLYLRTGQVALEDALSAEQLPGRL
jgi:hypothetical protein